MQGRLVGPAFAVSVAVKSGDMLVDSVAAAAGDEVETADGLAMTAVTGSSLAATATGAADEAAAAVAADEDATDATTEADVVAAAAEVAELEEEPSKLMQAKLILVTLVGV